MTTQLNQASDTFLERIVAATRAELDQRKVTEGLDALRARAADASPPRDFAAALRPPPGGPARLIGEVKRASPSRGDIVRGVYEPLPRALAYEAGGAAAISVLTERRHFHGSLAHLTLVRSEVRLPVLRKDFILDPYQVYEARAAGADAILLILAILDDTRAASLLGLTRSLGMEALVEAHNAAEVRRAVALDARVIGVNSRDLRTFAVDTAAVRALRALVPPDRIYVAESGVTDRLDVTSARAWGADAVLVGETLMRSLEPEDLTRALATAPGGSTQALFGRSDELFVKICGVSRPEHARIAAEVGASAIGLNFAAEAPEHRRVTSARAAEIIAALGEPGTPGRPIPVGVFVNTPIEYIASLARSIGLEAIQLSGDAHNNRYRRAAEVTGLPIIAAARMTDGYQERRLANIAEASATILLDSAPPGQYGGSGQTGDWTQARAAAASWPIILAGGLTPRNVRAAIKAVAPRGVDVSSGVEFTCSGRPAKNPRKIRAFIAAARGAASEL